MTLLTELHLSNIAVIGVDYKSFIKIKKGGTILPPL
jgi:hypothetical protein